MKRTFPTILVLMVAWIPPVSAQNETNRQTVSFSDPSRPGTLVVRVMSGSITIKAYDGKVVAVESTGPRAFDIQGRSSSTDPADIQGLRRIDNNGGNLGIDEANNTIAIQSRRGSLANLQIQVPVRTNITVNANSGRTVIEGVDGEIEVNGANGDIVLTEVSGSVVAHSNQGKITGTIRRATAQKPMSFVTNNGIVDITLPPDAKANIKARTLDGEIYTGFAANELALQPFSGSAGTPTTDFPTIFAPSQARGDTRGANINSSPRIYVAPGPFHVDINRSAIGALNGGGPDFEFRTLHGNIYIRKRK